MARKRKSIRCAIKQGIPFCTGRPALLSLRFGWRSRALQDAFLAVSRCTAAGKVLTAGHLGCK